ncbi:MAG: hypothetical protein IPN46_19140 [Saprospiraceae bacterium]|nr:hypothetical protein [Saprospiraceae bacterium]
MFQKIVRENDALLFERQTTKYFNASSYETNLDIIKSLYKTLQQQYRCEYVYKNNLVQSLIKEHSLKTTLILNELKLVLQKADLVMLNGAVRI